LIADEKYFQAKLEKKKKNWNNKMVIKCQFGIRVKYNRVKSVDKMCEISITGARSYKSRLIKPKNEKESQK
jgi:hypothetical protein